MKCFPSAAAYHAYWRHHTYYHVIRAGWFVLCVVTAAGVGGAGSVIFVRHFPAAQAQSPPSLHPVPAQLDAP